MAAYITVGAKTTHGGTVISGSPHTTHNGIPIARVGDKVMCKKCKKMTTIVSGDAAFVIDGAPIARAGDTTSCGAKLVAIQQSFADSDFSVMGIEQALPLVFPKSEPNKMFSNFMDSKHKDTNDDDQYQSNIIVTDQDGNPIPEDEQQELFAGPGYMGDDLTKPICSEKRTCNTGYGSHGDFWKRPSRVHTPQLAYSNEDLARMARVYGENSPTGQVGIQGMKDRGVLEDYKAQQEEVRKSRADNLAMQAQQRVRQTPSIQRPTHQQLSIQNGIPPDLREEVGYENPLIKVRDTWKGEFYGGLKDAGKKGYGAVKDVNPTFNAVATTGENIMNRDVDALTGQAVDKAKDTATDKAKDFAKDIAPKPIRNAWNAYDDYTAVTEKVGEIKDAIPKD